VSAVNKHLEKLEQYYLPIQQAKNQGVQLQSVLISVSTKDCSILALEGGRNFRLAPFNRALLGKRQPGSLFKPFVFLTAFENTSKDMLWTPDTVIEDTPFEWKYEGGQTWVPRNYDEKFKLQVTVREALESSINVPTARVAEKVGIQNIVKNIQKAGVRSTLPVVPSISLGSAEVTPLELTEAYTTFANLGQHCTLRGYNEIFDENKNLISENKLQFEKALSPKATFQTIDVLKGVFTNGTARSVKNTSIPYTLFAGKTGTTNDYKDAWFVGFNPDFLTLVWVGYDENRNVGLTGSVAALPIWVDYISKIGPAYLGQNIFTLPPEN
jgi:membrane carboxypeptidase/penicillin-binding protein